MTARAAEQQRALMVDQALVAANYDRDLALAAEEAEAASALRDAIPADPVGAADNCVATRHAIRASHERWSRMPVIFLP